MNTLLDDIVSYLDTLGFSALSSSDNYLVAQKAGFGGTQDIWQIWVPPIPDDEDDLPSFERNLGSDIETRASSYPGSSRWLVAHSLGGLTTPFRSKLETLGVRARVPVQFFDSSYKSDELPSVASSFVAKLRRAPIAIPQPFTRLANSEPEQSGSDLVDHLRRQFRTSRSSGLTVVVGPAGAGKTWFFRNLFSDLYSHFLERKKRQESFPRPVPLTPEYLRERGVSLRAQDLVREFVETELATHVPQRTFEWLLTSGKAVWLFDGLDELYAGDPYFFDYISDLLTRPSEGNTQLLICARASLMVSCRPFADFLADFPPGRSDHPAIHLYRLDPWEHESKRAYADLHFDTDHEQKKFLACISKTDALRSLSSLPFYCSLLAEDFKAGAQGEFLDDFALFRHTIESMIHREEQKGILVADRFQPNGLNEWLETLAAQFYSSGQKGVSVADAETYADLVLNPDLSPPERHEAITTLVQFPLFAPEKDTGLLTFEHELFAEYMLAQHLAKRIVQKPHAVARDLAPRDDLPTSVIGRALAHELPRIPGAIEAIATCLKARPPGGREFAALLQLLLMASPEYDLLKRHRLSFEARDLSGIRFQSRDLSGYSFRRSDLTGTVFDGCSLQGCLFEGASLVGTKFAGVTQDSLLDARFGNVDRFEHVYVGQRLVDDRTKFAEWVTNATGTAEPLKEACPTAMQFMALFRKFVHPDGTGRRDQMSASVMSRGKHYPGAPSPEECLEAAIDLGYVQRVAWHDQVKRVPGDRYDDMVDFVKDWTLSVRMRSLLDRACPIRNCMHIPEQEASTQTPV